MTDILPTFLTEDGNIQFVKHCTLSRIPEVQTHCTARVPNLFHYGAHLIVDNFFAAHPFVIVIKCRLMTNIYIYIL
jgi:hypothetical protein